MSAALAHMRGQPTGAPPPKPWTDLADMLADPGLQSLQYILDMRVFDDVPLREENLAVLSARVGEGRADFLSALMRAGVESVGDRQLFANALTRGTRSDQHTTKKGKKRKSEKSHT